MSPFACSPVSKRSSRRASRASRPAIVESVEARLLMAVSTFPEYRGVNALDDYNPSSCVTQAKAWGTQIIREGIHSFNHAIFGSGWDPNWNAHGLQDIATANSNAGVITMFVPFSWNWDEIRNYTPSGTGSNSFDTRFGAGSWNQYNTQLYNLGSQFRNQPLVWIEVWNEPYDWAVPTNSTTWLGDMKTMVTSIRNSGFTGKIVIPGGQNAGAEDVILAKGMELVNYDPQHNIIFDLHAYNNWFDGGQAGMEARIDSVLNAGLQMIFGEFGSGTPAGFYDVTPFLNATQSRQVGALAWSWNYGDGSAVVESDGSTPRDTWENYNFGTKVKNFLSGTRASLPSGWTDSDIGGPAIKGGAGYESASGSWYVSASGSDIWNASDQFNYVSRSVSGDQTITARVVSQRNTDGWAKSGVMFRNGTGANAQHVSVVVTPSNGVSLQWRSTAGGASSSTTVAGVTGSVWVRLTRAGNSFTGYYSTNGSSWTKIGNSQTISMPSSYRAGLAVTAHTNSNVNYARFTNVAFGMVPFNQTIGFKSTANNLYVSNNRNSSGLMMANWATSIGTWEQFTVVDAGGGYVGIRSNITGNYVSVNQGDNSKLTDFGATQIQDWEKFQWVWVNESARTFALRSNITGKYVTANLNDQGILYANWATSIGSWETFAY